MDILDCNVQQNVFTHFTDGNTGLHATVAVKTAIMSRAVNGHQKVLSLPAILFFYSTCVRNYINTLVCSEFIV